MKWFHNLNSWALDKQLQVRAFFSPSDYTREAFSTVSRLYVIWMTFLVLLNAGTGILSWTQGEWNEGFLYMLIAALFAIMFANELMLNMAHLTIRTLLGVAADQHKALVQIMDAGFGPDDDGEFD